MTFSHQNIVILVLIVFFVVFLAVSVLRISSVEVGTMTRKIRLLGPAGERVTLSVEIADDSMERQIGLMHRESLPAGTGMLFLFDAQMPLSFWMKNTLIPLDILFFDQSGRFVSRASMEPCAGDPCPTTPSAAATRYALEVNRAEAKTADVGEGWTLEMDN